MANTTSTSPISKAFAICFASVGKVDAVVSAAGSVHFGPLLEMTPEQLQVGIGSKLMGQVHLALEAAKYLNAGGSVTLVAGTLSKDPIRYGASASLVNGALESFVRSAALEFPVRNEDQRRQPDGIARIDGSVRLLFSRERRRSGQARRPRLRQEHRGRSDRSSLLRRVTLRNTHKPPSRRGAGTLSSCRVASPQPSWYEH